MENMAIYSDVLEVHNLLYISQNIFSDVWIFLKLSRAGSKQGSTLMLFSFNKELCIYLIIPLV